MTDQSRKAILRRLSGVKPFGIKTAEAAALCAMSTKTFKSLCRLRPIVVGNSHVYLYDDVGNWFREYYNNLSGADMPADSAMDWIEQAYGDDEGAKHGHN